MRNLAAIFLRWLLPCSLAVATVAAAQAPRMVLIDQDGSGPGGSNQMAMMVLLQSPQVKVLGITMVSGNAWEPEEVAHTLRMLELIHRTDVPVVPGAVFPLLHTEAEAMHARAVEGSFPWYGAWGDLAAHTSMQPYHGPFVIPPMAEGEPTTRPLAEDAAHFLLREVRARPHQVTIYAAGPLTNIALAISIDPEFAELTQGIVIMGGSLSPRTDDPEFATHPRHEFNFWFDPEAAHITFWAKWPRITLTDVDISVKTHFTPEMMREIAQSKSPAAQYIAQYTREFYYLWDELAAAAWIDPKIITKEQVLYVDVDTERGPDYGDTLTWTAANKPTLSGPEGTMQPVHVQEDLDVARFDRMFVDLMKAGPVVH
jgi:inosine-uridine nucleoside N-ribohydrolase